MYRVDEGRYWVRAKATDLRTGKKEEVSKLIEGVSVQQAAQQRAALFEVAKNPAPSTKRTRVREYAKEWLESKKLRIDPSTAKTYEAALEKRILPTLGDYYFDALTSSDVQKWIDTMTRRGWWSEEKGSKNEKTKKVRRTYTRKAMEVWFRVLQTMARDAMVALDLPRDRILDQLREAPMPVLHSLATTLRSWRDEVARMWRFTKSNAITEGLHNKMEVISRRAYGFRNFQNYRLRVRALCG